MEKISDLVLSSRSQLPASNKPDYRRLCQLLDSALETKNRPDYGSFSYEQCRQYAIGRFKGFLIYGVHNYVENQPFIEFDRDFKDWMRKRHNPSPGIKQDHPILNAYFRFSKALDLEPRKFDVNSLSACANELDFLFGEFLKQGARAFATNLYRPIENDLGIFVYHCCGGPLRPQHQRAIHEMIMSGLRESSERKEKLHAEIEETYRKNHPLSVSERLKGLTSKIKGLLSMNQDYRDYLNRRFIS